MRHLQEPPTTRLELTPALPTWAGVGLVAFGTAAVFCMFFGEALFGKGVYYSGDVARIYLPQRVALTQALRRGGLPWWSKNLGAGYPLLAEGETGALYPLNWAVCLLFSPELGLTVSILLNYLLTGVGMYLYLRALGHTRSASWLGATVWSLGGFNIAHLSHVSILSVSSWLPWLFLLTHRVLCFHEQRTRFSSSLLLAVVVALQFLAGHAQISLLSLMALGAYALALSLARQAGSRRIVLWLGALSVGTVVGLAQLWPTYELATLSQRSGGLSSGFFTSFSFHPVRLLTYLSPFLFGNPYPRGSVELMGYVGLLPLALAWMALRHRRDPRVLFFGILGVVGVVMALGRWNPMYRSLQHVPVLNLFRVPARYLYWTSLALAALSASGLDAVGDRTPQRDTRWPWPLDLSAALALAIVMALVTSAEGIERLVQVWRWLPLILTLATLGVVAAARRIPRVTWVILACATVTVDLFAYGAVLDKSFNATKSKEDVARRPLSLDFFAEDRGLYRTYSKEKILPALSVMEESLYPNMALTHDIASASIYLPLIPRSYSEYAGALDAERLNRLNVKYYIIPQLLPVDAESELYDVHNPFSSPPTDVWLDIPSLPVIAIEVESYVSHSAHLKDGAVAAEVVLRQAPEVEVALPLLMGVDTAEWAWERDDVRAEIAHAMPEIASTWPARSGFPPRDHPGHTYRRRYTLAQDGPGREPVIVDSLMIHPVLPEAFVRIERVRLFTADGRDVLLNHLVGLGDHSIVYRSEDAVIYRNEDVLPRAFTVSVAQVAGTGAEASSDLSLPKRLSVADVRRVDVLVYEDTQVEMRTTVYESSYLVLSDLYYPGWQASVDGAPAAISPVDGVFRAVYLDPGTHTVRLAYSAPFALY